MIIVMAVIHTRIGKYEGAATVPTFYLDPQIQGIVGPSQAARVAGDVLAAAAPDGTVMTVTIGGVGQGGTYELVANGGRATLVGAARPLREQRQPA